MSMAQFPNCLKSAKARVVPRRHKGKQLRRFESGAGRSVSRVFLRMTLAAASLAAACSLAALYAAEVPAGTEIQVRLKTRIASNGSKANDAIEASVIAPVTAEKKQAIPAG